MTASRTWTAAFAAALLAAACGGEAPAPGPATGEAPAAQPAAPAPAEGEPAADAGITARTHLDQALAEAAKWQADAQLVLVTTSLAEGPRHAFWFYDVQSPAAGTCTRIRVLANGPKIDNVGSGEACVLMKPVSTAFVDSPAAFDAARAAGFQPGDSVQFGLRFQRDDALPEPRECWVLWSDLDGDEAQGITRGWCVDPSNGQFVTRLSGHGGTVSAR